MVKLTEYFYEVLDWSEVWAMVIPLSVLLFRRQPVSLKPVIVYLWLGFLVNVIIDVIAVINEYEPGFVLSNNPLYNIHSVIRISCFSYYFLQLQKNSFHTVKRGLVVFSVFFLLVNFIFFDKFFNFNSFSGNLLTFDAYVLLIYCMLYYLTELKTDDDNPYNSPHFWVVTGLGIYVVVNFFVFLFYLPMLDVNMKLAINIWNIHNISFILFCLFLTKAFYDAGRHQYSV